MNSESLIIRTFELIDSDPVNLFIRGIQLAEFGFTKEEFPQPELLDIEGYYLSSGGNFWVAHLDDILVGTGALLDLKNGVAKLGRTFVHPEYRGKPWRIGQKLLDTAMSWAKKKDLNKICFETTLVFHPKSFFILRRLFEWNTS